MENFHGKAAPTLVGARTEEMTKRFMFTSTGTSTANFAHSPPSSPLSPPSSPSSLSSSFSRSEEEDDQEEEKTGEVMREQQGDPASAQRGTSITHIVKEVVETQPEMEDGTNRGVGPNNLHDEEAELDNGEEHGRQRPFYRCLAALRDAETEVKAFKKANVRCLTAVSSEITSLRSDLKRVRGEAMRHRNVTIPLMFAQAVKVIDSVVLESSHSHTSTVNAMWRKNSDLVAINQDLTTNRSAVAERITTVAKSTSALRRDYMCLKEELCSAIGGIASELNTIVAVLREKGLSNASNEEHNREMLQGVVNTFLAREDERSQMVTNLSAQNEQLSQKLSREKATSIELDSKLQETVAALSAARRESLEADEARKEAYEANRQLQAQVASLQTALQQSVSSTSAPQQRITSTASQNRGGTTAPYVTPPAPLPPAMSHHRYSSSLGSSSHGSSIVSCCDFVMRYLLSSHCCLCLVGLSSPHYIPAPPSYPGVQPLGEEIQRQNRQVWRGEESSPRRQVVWLSPAIPLPQRSPSRIPVAGCSLAGGDGSLYRPDCFGSVTNRPIQHQLEGTT